MAGLGIAIKHGYFYFIDGFSNHFFITEKYFYVFGTITRFALHLPRQKIREKGNGLRSLIYLPELKKLV